MRGCRFLHKLVFMCENKNGSQIFSLEKNIKQSLRKRWKKVFREVFEKLKFKEILGTET